MRRQLLAVVTAAFIVLQPTLFASALVSLQKKSRTLISRGGADTAGPNISVTTLGTPITQNFDTLATSGTANTWTDDTTLNGWFAQFSATGQTANPTTYRASTGTDTSGAIYSFGVAGTNALTERAFGSIGSGTPGDIYWALKLTNNTGSTITSLDVSFTGEQWRQGGCTPTPCTPVAQTLDFQYQVANSGVITDANTPTTGWLDENALDFTSPQPGTSTAAAIDGNAAANRTALSSTITVTVNNGQEVWLRWKDINHAGNDHGLSIDNFSVTPQGAGGGGQPSLSINDVTLNEGNAGTTAFTFTVSLSSSTHGGVTFDIATADGTAQDDNPNTEDNDYAAKSLTGQTIANGSNSAQFTVDVNGDTTTEPNETFFVNVTNVTGATVSDGQGQGTITNDDIIITPIHTIQGSTDTSPFAGQTATTTGIVTLLRTGSNAGGGAANGFFLQTPDANADADPNTSQGIFVFTSTVPTVSVGDEVNVTGTVVEFNGLTEISSVTNVSVLDTGNTLPTAITLDSTILSPTAVPTKPQLEKFEAMRMTAVSLKSVSPNDNFFDVDVVLSSVPREQVFREPGIPASDPVPPDPTSGTPDCCIAIWDENPERLNLDTNGRAGAPNTAYTSNVTFTNVAGPLDFAFGEYRLIPDATPTASANMTAVPVPTPTASEFTVAGYNIENFNNNATQREKASLTIRNVLHYPDIIGAVEIFDLADLQALRDEVNNDAVTAGDPNPQYEAFLVEQDGTSNDNDQDVGFLVKTSRVSVTSVTQEREEETFINPNTGNPETLHDRPPLVLDATVDPSGANPRRVLVVVNHLRSFIDVDLVAGDGPRVREKRKKQAESLADLLNDLQTANPGVSVISVGDYNAFQFSSGYDDSISVIKGNPTPDDQIVVDQSPDLVNPDFVNLIDGVPAAERYSFVFEGTPQVLDHVLVNTVARARNTRIAIARVNADFPDSPAAAFETDATRPERNSDHDPVVAYFSLSAAQPSGSLVISELRFRGPGNGPQAGNPTKGIRTSVSRSGSVNVVASTTQSQDEFVELYNNTDSDITVSTTDGSAGWTVVSSTGSELFRIDNGTVIPARGHYLGTNSGGYSLNDYGGTNAASGDSAWAGVDIPDGGGVAVFRSNNPANYTLDERLDAAGYTSAPALYREGAGFPTGGAETTNNLQYSFFRDFRNDGTGNPKDTGNNATDFISADTAGTAGLALGRKLGAPGPENLASPILSNTKFAVSLLDTSASSSSANNRTRKFCGSAEECDPNRSQFGTMSIRRRFTNNTGGDVTRLRFRIVDVTTFPTPNGSTADLRAISSSDIVVTVNAAPVNVRGTTLEEPPAQALGGGWNSSLNVGFVNLGAPLANGDSVSVQFLLGVQQTGNFRFFINIEADDTPANQVGPVQMK